MGIDDGDLFGECGKWFFWWYRADNVCFHPGSPSFIDAIQGQKCLCCLIGSNSIALSDTGGFFNFPGKQREEDSKTFHFSYNLSHNEKWTTHCHAKTDNDTTANQNVCHTLIQIHTFNVNDLSMNHNIVLT